MSNIPVSLAPGTTLGPYLIQERIGAGGMGAVWKARDTRLDRTVAIKTIEGSFNERFEREAKAIASLNHPNICTLHDVGENYLVMEFIDGQPVKGPLPAVEVARLGAQIAEALDAAHRRGLTHRDLKPGNVLVTKAGATAKVIDFGLAKGGPPLRGIGEAEVTLTKPLTAEGSILGTVPYMSPEQLQGHEADARSDIFALGCVLYEVLTGKRAFEGKSQVSIMAAILEHEPAPLSDVQPATPAWLDRIIRRCLRKNPDDRWQSARDIAIELREPHSEARPEAGTSRSPRIPGWAIAVAAVVAGAFLGRVLWTPQGSSQERASDPVRLSLAPPAGTQFGQRSFAISPDGATLAFTAGPAGNPSLWLRSLDGLSERMVPGTEGASGPFWSPDARAIGYFAADKLWRADVAGGTPLAICEVGAGHRGAAWGENGAIVFSMINRGLFRVAAAGGAPVLLVAPDRSLTERTLNWPHFVSAERFLYLVRADDPGHVGVYTSTLSKPSQRTRLIGEDSSAAYSAGHVLWLRGTTLMAQPFDPDSAKLTGEPQPVTDPVAKFAPQGHMVLSASRTGALLLDSSRAGARELTWLDREGKRTGAMPNLFGSGAAMSYNVSSDGKRLAFSDNRPGPGYAVWWMDMERGSRVRVTPSAGNHSRPRWARDGRRIAYSGGLPFNLFWVDIDSRNEPQRLTESPNSQTVMDWSGDSRHILYREIDDKGMRLWTLALGPDGRPSAKPRRLSPRDGQHFFGQFSPGANPRWVAYDSDESGSPEVYVQSFPEPDTRIQISKGGGRSPWWPADAPEILFETANQHMMSVAVSIRTNAIVAAEPRLLFRKPETGSLVSFEATADGQRFLLLLNKEEANADHLTVVLNWTGLLRRKVAK